MRRPARNGARVAAIIPLGPSSRWDSSGLPEGRCGASCDDAVVGPGQPSPPIWPCTTRGLPCRLNCSRRGGLLPHLFTLAMRAACGRPPGDFASRPSPKRRTGGIFSVALSVAAPPRHALRTRLLRPGALVLPGALPISPQPCGPGLRCPDFPPGLPRVWGRPSDHPACPPLPSMPRLGGFGGGRLRGGGASGNPPPAPIHEPRAFSSAKRTSCASATATIAKVKSRLLCETRAHTRRPQALAEFAKC